MPQQSKELLIPTVGRSHQTWRWSWCCGSLLDLCMTWAEVPPRFLHLAKHFCRESYFKLKFQVPGYWWSRPDLLCRKSWVQLSSLKVTQAPELLVVCSIDTSEGLKWADRKYYSKWLKIEMKPLVLEHSKQSMGWPGDWDQRKKRQSGDGSGMEKHVAVFNSGSATD